VKAQREFPKARASVAAARNFARDELADLPAETLESVVLMISELATNALIHTSEAFAVTIDKTRRYVRVAVTDGSALEPVQRFPSASQPHGRGLQIVAKLSDGWGSSGVNGDGKIVWFRVDLRRPVDVS
jgi:anti-sigma regulatory factor (Ser/Thr protein kinase)